ncbi:MULTISPECIES: DUF6777 domain-containing protein [Streptomyces]|uniref:DUF6777 domain-containing protein n=1 Tax=Streptomyces TaxID=1883 RepID=UPI001F0F06BE|nr:MULTISPECIES: DUF6777 domain-containing protein [Streptomyces]MDH6228375.1 hypothetical protein [Streptomyces sp. MJP52]
MPRVAIVATTVVAGMIVTVVLSGRHIGGADATDGSVATSSGEVFLQPAADAGPDTFTDSTAEERSSAPPASPSVTASPSPSATASTPQNAIQGFQGDTPGLYGGTLDIASCDVEKQITFFQEAPDKQSAFASVAEIQPPEVPDYLRSLTPVNLRMDTRVTNHGYKDGAPTSYQAVLQTGTAVLVDDRGVPRVRCACGNPLSPPVAQQSAPATTGQSWPGYNPSSVVVVTPAPQPVVVLVLCGHNGEWFERGKGGKGKDRKVPKPGETSSPTSTSSPTGTSTPPNPGTPPPGTQPPPNTQPPPGTQPPPQPTGGGNT